MAGREPVIPVEAGHVLERHGSEYGGWQILRGSISSDSVVVDIGLGEDISFSVSLMDQAGCTVHGFDPTPRAIAYVRGLALPRLVLHEVGVAARSGRVTFHLPDNDAHVSGSLLRGEHTSRRSIDVDVVALDDVFRRIGAERIDLLKLDVEGAEYDTLLSGAFRELAPRIRTICVEFHHRWPAVGPDATRRAVERLAELGFSCVWQNRTTNEEFTFVNSRWPPAVAP
jgi:FkbM family methyltransferase